MNIRKFLGKLVCIVSVINIMVLNVKGGVIVNAEEIVDIVDGDNNIELKKSGDLTNIAPTILEYMDIAVPTEMEESASLIN